MPDTNERAHIHMRARARAGFEDEVPAVLDVLGYPYRIQRGTFQSVGAPHAWPPVLSSLAWLVDLLTYSEVAADAEGGENDGFDDAAGEKMFFEYLAEGYALFLRASPCRA